MSVCLAVCLLTPEIRNYVYDFVEIGHKAIKTHFWLKITGFWSFLTKQFPYLCCYCYATLVYNKAPGSSKYFFLLSSSTTSTKFVFYCKPYNIDLIVRILKRYKAKYRYFLELIRTVSYDFDETC